MHTKSYKEHLREAEFCGLRWRILKLSPHHNQSIDDPLPRIRIVRTRCNSKACPRCQLLYYRKIRKEVFRSEINTKWKMFTVTGIHHYGDETNDLIRLEENFSKLRKHLKRKFPNFKYFAVKEFSPDGNWHYHGFWNTYIEFNELVKIWKKYSGAHRVWLKPVRNKQTAIRYIFKYCFKSVTNKRELEQLYETDKRKFSSSKGLLSKNSIKNPYTTEYGIDYSRDELIQELYTLIHNTDLTVDDFHSVEYPYFEDLMLNLYDKWNNEHPPNLFS